MPEGRSSGGPPDDGEAGEHQGAPSGLVDRHVKARPFAVGTVNADPIYRQVASRIREAILRGDVEPGAALPTERQLSETFGVSRTSIREALRELEAQGLLSPSRAAQARRVASGQRPEPICDALAGVLALQRVSSSHLLQLCCAVEAAAVRLAASASGVLRLHDAEQALALTPGAVSLSGYCQADARFHTALAAASGNPAFVGVTRSVRDALNRLFDGGWEPESGPQADLAALVREDECILAAVRNGEGERAGALCAVHVHRAYEGRGIDLSGGLAATAGP